MAGSESRIAVIDGVVPERVERPDTAEALAGLLAQASREGLPTIIAGGGTKLGWGRPPARVALLVGTGALTQHIDHRHGDLIATVDAGVTIEALNAVLAREGQWLPIDAPVGATVGGCLATNASGALRHRYGTPRDLLIGITLATTEGTLVRSGGQVVKNVAGYDLGKLVCGSHGTFAAIASATFKLVPRLPEASTLVARFADVSAAGQAMADISSSTLEPLAFDVRAGADAGDAFEIFVRFATTPSAVEAQLTRVQQACGRARCEVIHGGADAALWRSSDAQLWQGDGAVVRLGWLPANIAPLMGWLPGLDAAEGARVTLLGRAGVGAGFMRIDGPVSAQAGVIARLRQSPAMVRHVVVLRASSELKALVDVWGPSSPADGALRLIKRQFDPQGVLNAGRGSI